MTRASSLDKPRALRVNNQRGRDRVSPDAFRRTRRAFEGNDRSLARYGSVTAGEISGGCRSWDQVQGAPDDNGSSRRAKVTGRVGRFLSAYIYIYIRAGSHTARRTSRRGDPARARVCVATQIQVHGGLRCTRIEGEARSFREPAGRTNGRTDGEKSLILNGARTDIAQELEIDGGTKRRGRRGSRERERGREGDGGRYCEEQAEEKGFIAI